MWAVLWTDLVQFVIKMSAVIILAVYAVRAVGGMTKLKAGVAAHFGSETAGLSVLPVKFTGHGIEAYTWMPLLALGVFLSRAMVGGVVSGRGAGRRRLRGAAHLLGEDGARRRARDAVLSGGALRDSPVAVDHHRPGDDHALSRTASARRTITKRRTCRRSSICCRRRGAA